MRERLKLLLHDTPLYYQLRRLVLRRRLGEEVRSWERSGRPAPPPHLIKQKVLLEYAQRYRLRILVETGTYYGDMVEAMKRAFDQIYSIELSEKLFKLSRRRFAAYPHIQILQGDSATVLGTIMPKIDAPALFWLDGHFSAGVTARGSKDTPICEELGHILSRSNHSHVIIIDDARSFGTVQSYPTIEWLQDFVLRRNPDVNFAVENDSIRITPRQTGV